ncbi:unnamed protein product [Rhizophagus irregularis]|nr:unnamed protein product [Rhizophagus irregularis]
MQMNFLIDCGLDTSYFREFPSYDIIGSKAQQHSSVSVEVSFNISNHSDHTSSSNDAISENKENDKKSHYATEPTVLFGRQIVKELLHFFDWNVARSLYSIADIQSCIDKNLYELEVTAAYGSGYCNWMIDCGGEKISKCHHHPRDLRDKDGDRFETILIEIEIVLPTL